MLEGIFPFLMGGALIGLAASLMMVCLGRVCGVSNISYDFLEEGLRKEWSELGWRIVFILSLIAGVFLSIYLKWAPQSLSFETSFLEVCIGGFLVGLGTRIGKGCTSGHGICGLSRLSRRSFFAIFVFVITAIITVYIKRHIL